jgi:hypothetical protein
METNKITASNIKQEPIETPAITTSVNLNSAAPITTANQPVASYAGDRTNLIGACPKGVLLTACEKQPVAGANPDNSTVGIKRSTHSGKVLMLDTAVGRLDKLTDANRGYLLAQKHIAK